MYSSPRPTRSRPGRALVRSLLAGALVASGAAVGGGTATAAEPADARPAAKSTPAYTPTSGSIFSTPGRRVITRQILRNIRNSPPRSTIRAATAITDVRVAKALVAAHKRKVKVRVVMPTHGRGCARRKINRASHILSSGLGRDLSRRSWLQCVSGSARNTPGTPGHMHIKAWGFSRVGDATAVLLVTSQNATLGWKTQYNDAIQTVGWSDLYGAFVLGLFPQLRDDAGGGFFSRQHGDHTIYATPVSAEDDPVVRRIRAVPGQSSSVIRAAISVIERDERGLRAKRITNRLIRKHKAGVDVKVVYTRITRRKPQSVKRMCRAGIRVRQMVNVDGASTSMHSKYMTTSHVANGHRVHRTWAGSEEWKSASLNQDELVLGLTGQPLYDSYTNNWNALYAKAHDAC